MKLFQQLTSETGAVAIEFALLGVLLAVAVVGSVALVGNQLGALYRTVCGTVSAAVGGGAC